MTQKATPEKLLQTLFYEMWNNRDLSVADEIMIKDIPVHADTATIKGRDEFKEVVKAWCKAIPDLHYSLDEIIVSGEKAVVRWTGSGTLKEEFGGFKPTGKSFKFWGITITTIRDGKFQEAWVASDFSTVMMNS